MKANSRIDLLASLTGAVVGAAACAAWAFFVWQGSLLLVTACGALAGAFGGFFRENIVEALVLFAVASFGLWFLHRMSESGSSPIRGLFALLAGVVLGKLAGALTSLSSDDHAA